MKIIIPTEGFNNRSHCIYCNPPVKRKRKRKLELHSGNSGNIVPISETTSVPYRNASYPSRPYTSFFDNNIEWWEPYIQDFSELCNDWNSKVEELSLYEDVPRTTSNGFLQRFFNDIL